jgi:hypothetical protein
MPLPVPLSSPGCPDAAVLAAFSEGGLAEVDRARVAAHVASCDRCLDQVGGLVRLARETPEAIPTSLRDRVGTLSTGSRTARDWRPFAAAAVVSLSLGGWFYQRLADPPTPATVPAEAVRSGPPVNDRLRIVRPSADQRVPAGPFVVAWEGSAQAIGYRVRLMRDDGGLLWEGETPGATLTVPGTAALPTGTPLYLSVIAILPDGKTTRAPSVRFVVAPDQQ